MKSKSFNQNFI